MSHPADRSEWRTCLVIDTNQWIAHLMLRSATAAAVLYSLRQQGGVIGLPFVVEEELKRRAFLSGVQARKQVTSGLERLRQLLGSAPDPHLPGDDTLKAATSLRLDELSPLLERPPFTWSHAQAALRRVLDKTPPNSENDQQYKDSLIWEAVLELSSTFDVVLVTADVGFYAERKPANGLADELAADLRTGTGRVTAVTDLAAAAELLQSSRPPVDIDAATAAVDDAIVGDVRAAVDRHGFEVDGLASSSVRVFVTENPDVIAVTFTITYALDDPRTPRRSNAQVTVEGDCLLHDGQTLKVQLSKMDATWTEPDGTPGRGGTKYLRTGSTDLGERHKPYVVRRELV